MIILDLDPRWRARIWIGELPDIHLLPVNTVEQAFTACGPGVRATACSALELFLRRAHNNSYALLGAQFEPASSGPLVVQLDVTPDNGSLLDWALSGRLDEVRAGLPQPFVEGVIVGVTCTQPGEVLGSGRLRFSCAAHGMIGSAPDIFGKVASAVVRLLQPGTEFLSEKELVERISACIRSYRMRDR